VFAECGADLAVADIDLDGATKAVGDLLQFGHKAQAFQADVTRRVEVERMVKEVIAAFGQIDILVTCAGIHGAPGYEVTGYSEADWDTTFHVNVKGTVLVAEAVVQHMMERRSGKIVTIASHGGRGASAGAAGMGDPFGGAYGASKAAVIHLTQTYAIRLAPYNINVNCICPGSIFTPFWRRFARQVERTNPAYKGLTPRRVYEKWIRDRCPLGRPQTPEDIGKAAAFFASEDSMNITGQALNVNGGARIK